MSTTHASALRLKVLGLEQRAANMFRLFLKGPCHNKAVIVEDGHAADACLIDIDGHHGVWLLSEQKKAHPDTIFIVLSIKRYAAAEGIIFVQKPARTQDMLTAIERVREMLAARGHGHAGAGEKAKQGEAMKVIRAGDRSEQSATHRVAMMLDEQSFGSYLGHMDDVDPKARWQWRGLFIDSNQYLQAHIENAVHLALQHGRPTRVETRWKPIYVFPEQRLISVNAEDAQIRSACGVPFEKIAIADITESESGANLAVTELKDEEAAAILQKGNTVAIESFLWKMALWTSKGKLPAGFDPHRPVSLQRWPNFTRVLITPHAMRIAALLWHKPATLFDVASTLGIRQQFVFAFFYAAHVLGLMASENAAAPGPKPEPPPLPAAEKAERSSLLGKILKRLKVF